MALDKDRLGNAIADAALTFMGVAPGAGDEASFRDLMKAVADEIIKEFITNAVVTTGVVTLVTAVTPGVGTAPGTGTGTGGISS